jgi:hypothetical protein
VLSSAKDISVFPQLSAQIVSHSKTHNLVWTQRSGSTASADTIDADYGDCPFIILTLGKVSRDPKYHGLNPLQTATYSLTNKKLASTLKRVSHPTDPDCVLLAICMYIVPSILFTQSLTLFIQAHAGATFEFLSRQLVYCMLALLHVS